MTVNRAAIPLITVFLIFSALFSESVENLYLKGIEYTFNGNIERAEEIFKQCILINPHFALAHTALGNIYLERGEYNKAISEYNIALKLKPEDALTKLNLSISYLKVKEIDKAIDLLENLSSSKGATYDIYRYLSTAYHMAGDKKSELTTFQRAIEHFPDDETIYRDYAIALLTYNEEEQATTLLYDALSRFPGSKEIRELYDEINDKTTREPLSILPEKRDDFLKLAFDLEREGDTKKAMDVLKELTNRYPHFIQGYQALGIILSRLGMHNEAIEALNRAIELGAKDDAYTHYNLGIEYANTGQLDKAIEEYHISISIHRDFPEAHLELGRCLNAIGETAKAMTEIKTAVELNPTNSNAWREYALTLAVNKRWEEALNAIEKALTISPDNIENHLAEGYIFFSVGDNTKAKRSFTNAIKLAPNDPNPLTCLGIVLSSEGNIGEAEKVLKKALELDKDNSSILADLGEVYLQKKEYSKAIRCFSDSIYNNPDYIRAYIGLGTALWANKEYEKAIDVFKKVKNKRINAEGFEIREVMSHTSNLTELNILGLIDSTDDVDEIEFLREILELLEGIL